MDCRVRSEATVRCTSDYFQIVFHCDPASVYQLQGKYSHSAGGEIEIQPDATGTSIVILHPTVGKQTMETGKFLTANGLDYFGFKGKLEGNNITWNNGVVWKRVS